MALAICDRARRQALPWRPVTPMSLVPGEGHLDYILTLVANSRALKSESYTSAIRFRQDYF